MSKVKDTFFGGAEKRAGKKQEEAAQNASKRISEAAAQARSDALGLFSTAADNRQQGAQSALDIFSGALPQQAKMFRQGNVGAQEALAGGLSRFRGDILGLPPQQAPKARSFFFDPRFMPSSAPQQQSVQQGIDLGSEIIKALSKQQ